VGGHVRSPGPVSISASMTLWQAIQKAGGATEFGSLRRVKLFREGKQKTFDLTKDPGMTEMLKANDTLEVPQRVALGS
jgi:protein involved in polysaccharide export with SLBB domain